MQVEAASIRSMEQKNFNIEIFNRKTFAKTIAKIGNSKFTNVLQSIRSARKERVGGKLSGIIFKKMKPEYSGSASSSLEGFKNSVTLDVQISQDIHDLSNYSNEIPEEPLLIKSNFKVFAFVQHNKSVEFYNKLSIFELFTATKFSSFEAFMGLINKDPPQNGSVLLSDILKKYTIFGHTTSNELNETTIFQHKPSLPANARVGGLPFFISTANTSISMLVANFGLNSAHFSGLFLKPLSSLSSHHVRPISLFMSR